MMAMMMMTGVVVMIIRVRFFKKIQNWILNPRSLGSWCVKETEESISRVDSSVPLIHNDPRDL